MPRFFNKTRTLLPAFLAVLLACPGLAGAGVKIPEAAPAPGAYVNDRAGVMDAGTLGQLNGVLADLDAKAKAQVAVLTIKSLDGADLETYSVNTYKKWGIGDKKTNRGVLLLVAVEDHKARIEVGYGLEGILPDGLTGAIQDKYMVPSFKAGDYSTGISQGALALASVIAKDSGVTLSGGYAETPQGRDFPPLTLGQKIIAGLVLFALLVFVIRHPFLAFFLLQSMARGGGGGGGFGGGGFGGFGGGSSGGGGSSRSW
jgi:uncharacterized protein